MRNSFEFEEMDQYAPQLWRDDHLVRNNTSHRDVAIQTDLVPENATAVVPRNTGQGYDHWSDAIATSSRPVESRDKYFLPKPVEIGEWRVRRDTRCSWINIFYLTVGLMTVGIVIVLTAYFTTK